MDIQDKIWKLNDWFVENFRLDYTDLDFNNTTDLGKGSYGLVRTATHKDEPNTVVAVKIVVYTPAKYGTLYNFHCAIAREFDILQLSSDSPYVVPLIGVCYKALGQAVFVLEKYECHLGTYLHNAGSKSIDNWSVARQLVNIYRYLHYSLKIVHNDLKLDNILVGRHEHLGMGKLGVVDFGLSSNLIPGDIFQTPTRGYRKSSATGKKIVWEARHYRYYPYLILYCYLLC